jgi:hypothetical protein
MPKEKRGRYKKYLLDEAKAIPKSTIYYQNQNNNQDDYISTNLNRVLTASNIRSEYENFEPCEPLINENLNSIISTNHSLLYIDETNVNPLRNSEEISHEADTFDDDFNPILSDILSDNNLVIEDLAAAYLAAFFNGRTSLQSLNDYLKLSNIYSPVKLPTTFNGLKNLISTNTDNLIYEKSWFCGTCLKHFTQLISRLQRTCEYCKTR